MGHEVVTVAPNDNPRDQWRVRIPAYFATGDATVYADVDLTTETITLKLPDGTTTTVTPTTARAIKDTLSAAIFDSLGAPGPWLYAERFDPHTSTWSRPTHP